MADSYGLSVVHGILSKNFIHDYSNLNMADRRQVVFWEDYLVYAVVLEENEEIVNEIAKAVNKTKPSLTG